MATRIVEIVGPPGVGKTTIYNALCKLHRKSYLWSYPEALISPPPQILDFTNWLRYYAKIIFRKKITASFSSDCGLRFIQKNTELADFCWEVLSGLRDSSLNSPGMIYRAVFYLYQDFCRYQAIKEKNTSLLCVVNEGLLQKSFLNRKDEESTRKMVAEYLSLLPLPHAVIFINTDDITVIVDRLMNRSKIIASQQGMHRKQLIEDIRKWQYQLNLMISYMMNNGVNVYHINATKSLKENRSTLLTLISSLSVQSRSPENRISDVEISFLR